MTNSKSTSASRTKARVVTASTLSAKDKTAIKKRVSAIFPEVKTMDFVRDTSLIAGIRVEYADNLYEDTLIHNISQKES